VAGVALAAVGLWYDDYTIGGNPLTQDLIDVLSYTTGIEANDTTFRNSFPYVQTPWEGFGKCSGPVYLSGEMRAGGLQIGEPVLVSLQNFPNPFTTATTIRYHAAADAHVTVSVYDLSGKQVATIQDENVTSGSHEVSWKPGSTVDAGIYVVTLQTNGITQSAMKINYVK
jgi:hypothetical protein